MPPTTSHPAPAEPVDLATERAALLDARAAVDAKLDRLAGISGGGADALADEYIDAVVRGSIATLQRELVVFGRIDDDRAWRVGLYGIDRDGDLLVLDWRAPFSTAFYQARLDEPLGLDRRVTYVGSIDDLFVEDFARGEVTGSSPLLAELSRSRGTEMRAAVATLQSEQDALVRLAPTERLVLRGGPGTGKTVVGLHRAAWLVYNDRRITSDQILVLGPSERYLQFVATVLPTLGETKVKQTTFATLLGPSNRPGSDERWLDVLDRFERTMPQPAPVTLHRRTLDEDEVASLIEQHLDRALPWRDRRRLFVDRVFKHFDDPASRRRPTRREVADGLKSIWPACSVRQAWAKLRSRQSLDRLGVDADLRDAWLAVDGDGALFDEVRARFEGVPARYSHVIVDEAQDLSLFQLRAVVRRSDGFTLVGDDAQRSNPDGIGLTGVADLLDAPLTELRTAYRMSAEIAAWLNDHAARHGLPAVELLGIRPTGRVVRRADTVDEATVGLDEHWGTIAVLSAGEVWDHKGVEYDAVVVDAEGMSPSELYLAASRAAHELVIVGLSDEAG
jgi:AAA domain